MSMRSTLRELHYISKETCAVMVTSNPTTEVWMESELWSDFVVLLERSVGDTEQLRSARAQTTFTLQENQCGGSGQL